MKTNKEFKKHWITKTSTHMLVKNYKRTQNIVHVNQRMKYENVLSVQETLRWSVQETLQIIKVERVNNSDINEHVSQKLQTHTEHCTCKSKNKVWKRIKCSRNIAKHEIWTCE